MLTAAAHHYARALADIVTRPDAPLEPAEALAQIRAMEDTVAGSEDLRIALESPAVRPADKRAVIARLAQEMGLSRIMTNFVFVIVDHHRVAALGDIRQSFEQQIDERTGHARSEITSATPLSRDQEASIERELERAEGKKIRASYRVDADLIGGVRARVGSTVYDGSLRGQLEGLRRQLAHQAATA